jgi:hypothetical protein
MKIGILLIVSFFSTFVSAQTYGNEWISYDQKYFSFPVVEAGIHKIDYTTLVNAGVPLSSLNSSNFQIFGKENQIPLFIEDGGDEIMDTGDFILFYAEGNDGAINYDNVSSFSAGDYAFFGSYARNLKVPGLSLGGSAKVIYRKVGDFATSWGFGLDAGLKYKRNEHFTFGLMARDVTSTFNAWVFTLDEQTQNIFLQTGNDIPQNGLELTLPRLILAASTRYNLGSKGMYAGGEVDIDVTTDGKRNTLVKLNPFSLNPILTPK